MSPTLRRARPGPRSALAGGRPSGCADIVEPRRQLLKLPGQTPRELAHRLFHPCRTRGQLLAGRHHLPYAGVVLDIQFVIAPPRPYPCSRARPPPPADPSRVFPTSPVRLLREISPWIIATKCFKRMPFGGSRPRRTRCSIPLTQRCRRGSETQQTESPVAARG